jgi:transposase InsO family protein
VQDLLALAYLSQVLEGQDRKPLLRTDRGSPNLERGTIRLIRDLELVLSPGRADRPTDNARQERWYRSIKQEEIYLYPTYPSLEIARASLAGYIEYYNERRPHQALWNYTPDQVHRLGNKSRLIEHHRLMVKHVKEQRLRANRVGSQKEILAVSN